MANPRKTAGLINFANQLTEAFPDREGPDGWVGNEEHKPRRSSHNPDDTPGSKPEWDGDPDKIPDVRAIDFKSNLGPGVSSLAVCHHLAQLPGLGTVVRYIIHKGYIWHVNNGFKPVKHDGDPHPDHVHVTFAFTEAADDNTTFNYRFEEVPVRLTEEDKNWFKAEMRAAAEAAVKALITPRDLTDADGKKDGTQRTELGHWVFNQGVPSPFEPDGGRVPAYVLLGQIAQEAKKDA